METKLLTEKDIGTAAAILRAGGLVGIPTETVYGLGANGLDSGAVARIMAALGGVCVALEKGRTLRKDGSLWERLLGEDEGETGGELYGV